MLHLRPLTLWKSFISSSFEQYIIMTDYLRRLLRFYCDVWFSQNYPLTKRNKQIDSKKCNHSKFIECFFSFCCFKSLSINYYEWSCFCLWNCPNCNTIHEKICSSICCWFLHFLFVCGRTKTFWIVPKLKGTCLWSFS